MIEVSLPRLLYSSAKRYGPKVAISEWKDGQCREASFIDIWNSAASVADLLVQEGLPEEGRVAIVGPAGVDAVAAGFGVMLARGVACFCVDTDGEELKAALEQAEPWAILCPQETSNGRGGLWPSCPTFVLPKTLINQSILLEPDPAVLARMEKTGPGGHALSLPAGRGNPVLIDFMHRTLVVTAKAVADAVQATEEDRWLTLGPISTPWVQVVGICAPLVSGGEVALFSRARDVLEAFWLCCPSIAVMDAVALGSFGPRVMKEIESSSGFSGWLIRLGARAALTEAARARWFWQKAWWRFAARAGQHGLRAVFGGKLRVLVTSGEVDEDICVILRAGGVSLSRSLGPPEAAGLVFFERPGEVRPLGAFARPLDGMRVQLAPNGEVLASGHAVMLSHRRTEPGEDAMLKDGWLSTGLFGRVDDEGYFYPREKSIRDWP